MLEITSDTITKLRDQELSTRQPSVRSRTSVVEDEVVDNEMYLQDMEINRNWEIPRERLKITEEKLGEGEFGVVRKGIYLRKDGKELPVAVKMLKGLIKSVKDASEKYTVTIILKENIFFEEAIWDFSRSYSAIQRPVRKCYNYCNHATTGFHT